MLEAIIFDSDDTLIDFSCVASPIIQETARRMNLSVPHVDEIDRHWGKPLRTILNEVWGEVDLDEFKKIYYAIIAEKSFSGIEGAVDVVKQLHGKYELGVVSTKSKELIIKHFNDAGFEASLFKFMLGAEHSIHRKPDPKVFDKSLEILNIDPANILYIGDSIFDYQAANGAGINFVAVETGFYKTTDFVNNGIESANVIKSVKDLPAWLGSNP